MPPYHGNFLKVDLDGGRCRQMSFDQAELKQYIGGATLAAALFYPHAVAGLNPLAGETPLVFATGPLSAVPIPNLSRYAICSISALTGFWAEAAGDGGFSSRLKCAGFDGIFITGRALRPVVLEIDKDRTRVWTAEDLWGLPADRARQITSRRLGGNAFSMVLIDAAGERQVSNAPMFGDGGRMTASRGLGAVMGAKNLKAVIVAGAQKPVGDGRAGIRAMAGETLAAMLTSRTSGEYGQAGTVQDSGGPMAPCDGVQAAEQQNLKDLCSALGLIDSAHPDVSRLCKLLHAVTGWLLDPSTLLAAADRSVNLKRAVNIKLGWTRKHDRLLSTRCKAGDISAASDKTAEVTRALRGYYALRGWDWQTGKPSEAKLLKLGLSHVARGLYAIR